MALWKWVNEGTGGGKCDLVIFTVSIEYFHSFSAGVDLNSYIIAVI